MHVKRSKAFLGLSFKISHIGFQGGHARTWHGSAHEHSPVNLLYVAGLFHTLSKESLLG